MNYASIKCRTVISARRQGMVLIILMALFAISLTLAGVWAQSIVRENRRLAQKQWRLQATRLADAGLRRAVAQRAANPTYQDETWTAPAEQFAGTHSASVRIRATTDAAGAAIHYIATAEFPAGTKRRAQVTKELTAPVAAEAAAEGAL